MVTWGDVKRWQPGPLQGSVGPLNDAYTRIVACGDDLRGINTPYGWFGDAASAAANTVNKIIDGLEEHSAEVAAARRSFADTGDAITGIVHAVQEAEGLAATHHFTIGDDGAIIDNGPPPDTPEDQKEAVATERKTIAAELEDRVKEALRSATDVDDDFCAVLDKILSGHAIDATANDNQYTALAASGDAGAVAGSLTIPAPPAVGASPTDNAAWWATLSRQQQERLVADHPELMGNRDGVAAWARSKANLAMVPRERQKLLDERTELMREAPDDPRSGKELPDYLKDRLNQINDKLAALDKIDQITLGPDGKPLPNRQLLSLDMTGDKAKAAIANGDVDTAKNVAVFTPGMGSAVEKNLDSYVKDMQGVREAGNRMLNDPTGQSVATVTWLGYEPPEFDTGHTPDILSGASAEDGAAKLAKFDQGINASRLMPPHLTALGHSWGSLTTGIALHQNTGVDDAVFFGSPGVSDAPAWGGLDTNELHQLKVPDGHAYNLQADGDPVSNLVSLTGRYGSDPGIIPGMHQLSTQDTTGIDGGHLASSQGHSEYTKTMPDGADSTSKHNIAAVVAGRPDLTINAPG